MAVSIVNQTELMRYVMTQKSYKKAKSKQRVMWCSMPRVGNSYTNLLNGISYTTNKTTKFVLSGIYGEVYTIDVVTLAKTFTLEDGTPITATVLRGLVTKDGVIPWFKVRTISDITRWAAFIPENFEYRLQTQYGLQHLNAPSLMHNRGDFVVCEGKDAPNFVTMRVVNGAVFGLSYNNTGWMDEVGVITKHDTVYNDFIKLADVNINAMDYRQVYRDCMERLLNGAKCPEMEKFLECDPATAAVFGDYFEKCRKHLGLKPGDYTGVIDRWMSVISKVLIKTGTFLYKDDTLECPVMFSRTLVKQLWEQRFQPKSIFQNPHVNSEGMLDFEMCVPLTKDCVYHSYMRFWRPNSTMGEHIWGNFAITTTGAAILRKGQLTTNTADAPNFDISMEDFSTCMHNVETVYKQSVEDLTDQLATIYKHGLASMFSKMTGFQRALHILKKGEEYKKALLAFGVSTNLPDLSALSSNLRLLQTPVYAASYNAHCTTFEEFLDTIKKGMDVFDVGQADLAKMFYTKLSKVLAQSTEYLKSNVPDRVKTTLPKIQITAFPTDKMKSFEGIPNARGLAEHGVNGLDVPYIRLTLKIGCTHMEFLLLFTKHISCHLTSIKAATKSTTMFENNCNILLFTLMDMIKAKQDVDVYVTEAAKKLAKEFKSYTESTADTFFERESKTLSRNISAILNNYGYPLFGDVVIEEWVKKNVSKPISKGSQTWLNALQSAIFKGQELLDSPTTAELTSMMHSNGDITETYSRINMCIKFLFSLIGSILATSELPSGVATAFDTYGLPEYISNGTLPNIWKFTYELKESHIMDVKGLFTVKTGYYELSMNFRIAFCKWGTKVGTFYIENVQLYASDKESPMTTTLYDVNTTDVITFTDIAEQCAYAEITSELSVTAKNKLREYFSPYALKVATAISKMFMAEAREREIEEFDFEEG